jgi:hypothetical protein
MASPAASTPPAVSPIKTPIAGQSAHPALTTVMRALSNECSCLYREPQLPKSVYSERSNFSPSTVFCHQEIARGGLKVKGADR